MGVALCLLSGCALVGTQPETTLGTAQLEPLTNISADLINLPPPKGKIAVAVYDFKDQTGQYKQAPDSSFSTAVSQGGSAMLVKAMRDTGWFIPVEREALQNLLTERKIFRAVDQPGDKNTTKAVDTLPTLTPARLLIEGAVVGYDQNVATGGIGVKYLGIGASQQFHKDQITVNLRAVNTDNGQILHSVTTTKTVYSYQVQPGIYKFVQYQSLLEAEAGYTYNEPVQMAIREAIEAALVNMIVEGIYAKSWDLANVADLSNPVVQRVHEMTAARITQANARLDTNNKSDSKVVMAAPLEKPKSKYASKEPSYLTLDAPASSTPEQPAQLPPAASAEKTIDKLVQNKRAVSAPRAEDGESFISQKRE